MPTTFHHFSRKGYSLFAALGREVRIGVLSVATLSTAAPCQGVSLIAVSPADSATFERTLDEACVTAASLAPMTADVAARQVMSFSRDDIAAAGVTSINDLLKLCASVDVRQRGPHGVQTDISMGGGTFDQVTILLNGINVSSPHTGHLSAELPVGPEDIERVDILTGAAARVYGTQALTGVINIITRNSGLKHTPVWDGLHGGVGATGGGYSFAQTQGRLSAYGQNLSASYMRADGATPHSAFENYRAFLQGSIADIYYQLGYSRKPYDANTFYGASSTDQWERTDRWTGALGMRKRAGQVHIEPQVNWNRWYDHYQWHKGQNAGENYHRVDVYAVSVRSWTHWRGGTTAINAEARHEGIVSSKLGAPREQPKGHYTHAANRTNLSANLEHNIVWRQWTFSAGVLANMNTALDTRWRFYPGADAAWRPHRHWTLSATWNMALRMPTFTDLYYSGPHIEGTQSLRPERTNDVALRLQWQRPMIEASISATRSHRRDMIDWVIPATGDGVTFRSGNFSLRNNLLQAHANWLPRQHWAHSPLRRLGVQYAWVDSHIAYPQAVLQSKYAMEYLRHKLVINADGQVWRGLGLSLSYRWQQRGGMSHGAHSMLDGRISWQASTNHKLKSWELYADATNILNYHYKEFSYVEQPGQWVTGGFLLRF